MEEPVALPSEWRSFSAANMQPGQTIVLDLAQGDAVLLMGMYAKTRYNIRLAERHGVAIRWEQGPDAIGKFQRIMRETAARDVFHAHPSDYYAHLLAVRSPQFSNELAFPISA